VNVDAVNSEFNRLQGKTRLTPSEIYANILIHEILWHGILGYGDYVVSTAPPNSLGNNATGGTAPIGILPDEIAGVKAKLKYD
jgi:hypothetical protein